MKQLSPSARRLFELARGQDEPDMLARHRVARALTAKIAAGAGLTAAGVSASAAAGGLGAVVAKSALIAGLAGGLVASGWFAAGAFRPAPTSPPSSPRPAIASRPATAAPTPLPTQEPVVATPAMAPGGALLVAKPSLATKIPASRRPARRVEATIPAAPAATEDGLRNETEALRLAQQALRDRLPQRALQLLDEQEARFHGGVLAQERAAARVLALCQANQVDDARAEAVRFERLWPRSALLARVRSACAAP